MGAVGARVDSGRSGERDASGARGGRDGRGPARGPEAAPSRWRGGPPHDLRPGDVASEDAREIGTLKALGASDAGLVLECLAEEAIALTAVDGLLGRLLSRALGGLLAGRLFALGVAPFLPAQYKDTLFDALGWVGGAMAVSTEEEGQIIPVSRLLPVPGRVGGDSGMGGRGERAPR